MGGAERTASASADVDVPFAAAAVRLAKDGPFAAYAMRDVERMRRNAPWAKITVVGEDRYQFEGREPHLGKWIESTALFERPFHARVEVTAYASPPQGASAEARGRIYFTMTSDDRVEETEGKTRITISVTARAPGPKLPAMLRWGWRGIADSNRRRVDRLARELVISDEARARDEATAPARARLDRIGLACTGVGAGTMFVAVGLAQALPFFRQPAVFVATLAVGAVIMLGTIPLILKRQALERGGAG